jgi:septal ring factor EnvC (AmiA/AmiB activator)
MVEPSGRRVFSRLGAAAVVAALLGWSLAVAQDRRESEAELSAVRKEIKALQERVARETTRRDEGARALRASEVEIAAATRKLAEVSGNLRGQEKTRRDLEQETARANRRLGAEKDALARQVRSSYMAGREELTKLLLSQESPAALGRMLVYFDYYNRGALGASGRGRQLMKLAGAQRCERASKRSSRPSSRRRRARSRRSRSRATSAARSWPSSKQRSATATPR